MRGALDVTALQRALDAIITRHEALRTVFAGTEGEARQRVLAIDTVPMEQVDLSHLSGEAQTAEADRLVGAHALTPFDLTQDLLLRAKLLRLADDHHILCLNSHHIVSDGWSKSVLYRELGAFYNAFRNGETITLEPLPIQFADYAAWEREARHEQALAEPLAYWREQLAGPLPTLALPTDRPRPSVSSFEGARRVLTLPKTVVADMAQLAQRHGVTPYMVLLAAYVTLLHRYTGQDDIIVGSPIAGRGQAETEGLIGYFANTLVLRTHLDGDPSFAELLERVRDTALGAYDHQDVPFEKLVLELQKGQQLTHAPLFQVVLTMEDTVPAALELDGITVETLSMEDGATKFDLTMLVSEQPDGLRLSLWYRTDLFEPETVDRILGQLRTLLESAIENDQQHVSELRLLTPSDRRRVMALTSGDTIAVPDVRVHQLFERAVERSPDATAVVAGADQLSYGDLNAKANRLAHHLGTLGVSKGTPVGIALDRSADMIVALLAVLKAGGAYVPLPAELPAARVKQQLADSGARVVVTESAQSSRFDALDATVVDVRRDAAAIAARPDASPNVEVSASDVAYILFTSGSTGVPKGVAVTHGNIAHYVTAIASRLGVQLATAGTSGTPWSFATVSTLGADLGNTSLYPALASGGTLHVIPGDVAMDPVRYGEYMKSHHVDVLKITPGHLKALLGGQGKLDASAVLPAQWLVVGGEACGWELASDVLAAGRCRMLNHYGPTETTVGATSFEITRESAAAAQKAGSRTVPVGRPLPNARTYVVDTYGKLLPIGVPGELWIGGRGVAQGYINRPELTAERFLADPFAQDIGAGVYRTGDRVRVLATGDVEFLGRLDGQVKIRGYRVELGEIEHVLGQHPAVEQNVVVIRETPSGDHRLVAYVVAKTAGYAVAHADRPTTEKLGAWVAAKLPEYMVPSTVVVLDAMPLTANGKIDRAALPSDDAADTKDAYVAPSTDTERSLATIWEEVLKRERVGAHDDFLALGGHSLMAIRVLGKISRAFSVRLPLRVLFESPTIAQLAKVVDAEVEAVKARELESMLASLDGMSDDDVQRMMSDQSARGES